MNVNPQGIINLCNVPLLNNYKDTFTFNNANDQLNYFKSKSNKEYIEYSYVKENGSVKINDNVNDINNNNYLFFQNKGFTNKYYYAFITNMKYINEATTEVFFEIDVFQTWQFNLKYNNCFIEREHVIDDKIGKNTIPENLETGEYIINSKNDCEPLQSAFYIILGSTIDPVIDNEGNLIGGNNGGGIYGGIRNGYKYSYFSTSKDSELPKVLRAFEKAGKSDAIKCMFMAPGLMFEKVDPTILDNGDVKESLLPVRITWNYQIGKQNYKLKNLNGYVPKNNKMLTFPYCYINLTNNNGGSALLHYEKFSSSEDINLCEIDIYGTITPSMSIKAIPKDYNGINENYSESLICGKYPICGWQTDVFTNWLTQNAINNHIGIISDSFNAVAGVGIGIATGSAAAPVSGIMNVGNTLINVYNHSLEPPQASGNTNTGDLSYSDKTTTFTVYNMSIKEEYAKIIDNYFSMFGYKVNTIKTPNIKSRKEFNYIKTIDSNITGNIPCNDLKLINTIFNNGITFWHNTNNIFNYNIENGVR